MSPSENRRKSLQHYKRIASQGASVLESTGESFSIGQTPARSERLEADLLRVIETHLDNDAELRELARRIVSQSHDSYQILDNEDEDYLDQHPAAMASLEIVVHADGSRPSFLVRDGLPDISTYPAGDWAEAIAVARTEIKQAIAAAGRINCPSAMAGFEGSGFRIAKNLIATNRHVLQAVASRDSSGEWHFEPGVQIDFGHEYRAAASIDPCACLRVAFAATPHVDPEQIDHNVLDLVLIEIQCHDDNDAATVPLDITPTWVQSPGARVYTIGYPARPRPNAYPPSDLERLFSRTYNFKRFSPGEVMDSGAGPGPMSLRHDATTLGGNSGSLVVDLDMPNNAVAIHYGGTRREPRANWAHTLSTVLQTPDHVSRKTLSELLEEFQVKRIDRT